jgi:hypothetical protein
LGLDVVAGSTQHLQPFRTTEQLAHKYRKVIETAKSAHRLNVVNAHFLLGEIPVTLGTLVFKLLTLVFTSVEAFCCCYGLIFWRPAIAG